MSDRGFGSRGFRLGFSNMRSKYQPCDSANQPADPYLRDPIGIAASVTSTVVLADHKSGVGNLGSINNGPSKCHFWKKDEVGLESPVLQAEWERPTDPQDAFAAYEADDSCRC